jgi:hypothetical protein
METLFTDPGTKWFANVKLNSSLLASQTLPTNPGHRMVCKCTAEFMFVRTKLCSVDLGKLRIGVLGQLY